ncbi:hypothetical protein RCL_jg11917.t1 [Rhizophagus clarus]|uniref:Uncharacterized protein n=1 Tax=Rhizophagus clarus TaxID=94130 RepID=A0A8H3L8Z3_9GLOM|nr:hypothetical protein RCL_jg11917.t1 [Rhizophagus clarus]
MPLFADFSHDEVQHDNTFKYEKNPLKHMTPDNKLLMNDDATSDNVDLENISTSYVSDENILVFDEPLHDEDEYENLEYLELISGRVFSDWYELRTGYIDLQRKKDLIIKLD